jgi:LysM repeat protein
MKPRARWWGAAAGVLLALSLIAFRPDSSPSDRSSSPQTSLRRYTVMTPARGGYGPSRFVTAASNIYLVQPGDTLSLIASRFRVTETDLQTLNHLADAQSLYAGQHLLIPESSAK